MSSSKPPPQSRGSSQSRASPTPRPYIPSPRGWASPQARASPSGERVRYVDIRVAVPADGLYSPESILQYMNPPIQTPSPMSMSSHGTPGMSPHWGRRPSSPYGFIPIPKDDRGPSRFTPPASPYDFRKASPSPSMLSTVTSETLETSSMTLDSRMSPALASMTPSVYRQSPTPQDIGSRDASRPRTPTGRKSPFPKSDDDSVRKTRIKTEMCMHYSNGRPCPFGANCTYAHGEEELQMTKLLDLHHAGLIDVETYRTKPCLTWVMTGSCPFGKRCTGVHDPRVAGSHASWLPHTETQGNTIATDINVEALHQKRLNTILYDNPFGEQFSIEKDGWSDLYKLVCNIDYSKRGWIDKKRRFTINPIYKLQIALKLRGTPDWQYKYRPQHVIHEELCMVLQKRAFRLTSSMEAVEIPLSAYNSRLPDHVLVREIAFGPDSEPTIRGVALWFNIDEDNVQLCTPQQAKRFRWKRGIKKESEKKVSTSVFDYLDNFVMIRPHDSDAFDLSTDMMKHRLEVLKNERISSMKERFEALQKLESKKKLLQERFDNQKRHWVTWAWPVNVGREKVDKNTPVPPVDGEYELPEKRTKKDEDGSETSAEMGSAVRGIWDSFLSASLDGILSDESEELFTPTDTTEGDRMRSALFTMLAHGYEIDIDRTLPHILHHPLEKKNTDQPHCCRPQERCWKALLLESEDTHQGSNEWDIVRDHFENSRSKKVLTILQEKK